MNAPEMLARGLSWTMKRGCAAKYAQRLPDDPRGEGEPVLIAAEIRRERVLFFSDGHFEAEVIFAGRPRNVRVDGDPAAWRAWFQEWRAAVSDEWMRLLGCARWPSPAQRRLLAMKAQELGLSALLPAHLRVPPAAPPK
ncbi:hypothetical protein [Elioraea sp.]|uniref:hypothetical protein n=1 Tax=Elioraea sp. TaxID=2185103 RepID=UPI003F6FCD74